MSMGQIIEFAVCSQKTGLSVAALGSVARPTESDALYFKMLQDYFPIQRH